MLSHSRTHLMAKFRQRSSIVSAFTLLCLLSQALLPGLTSELPFSLFDNSADGSSCCVVNLTDMASSGCCCGPKAGTGCGCSCGKAQSNSQTDADADANDKSAPERRTFESEICGCGGKHRPGYISSMEPAVLPVTEFPVDHPANPALPEFTASWCANRVAPPTPPPEFVA